MRAWHFSAPGINGGRKDLALLTNSIAMCAEIMIVLTKRGKGHRRLDSKAMMRLRVHTAVISVPDKANSNSHLA